MKTLSLFIGVTLALGALALAAGYAFDGEDALVQGGTAFGLTFIPAAVSLAFVLFSYRSGADVRLLAGLGASGFRMAIALGGGLLLTSALPETFTFAFYVWLVVFYMGMLGFEIALVLRQAEPGRPATQTIPQA